MLLRPPSAGGRGATVPAEGAPTLGRGAIVGPTAHRGGASAGGLWFAINVPTRRRPAAIAPTSGRGAPARGGRAQRALGRRLRLCKGGGAKGCLCSYKGPPLVFATLCQRAPQFVGANIKMSVPRSGGAARARRQFAFCVDVLTTLVPLFQLHAPPPAPPLLALDGDAMLGGGPWAWPPQPALLMGGPTIIVKGPPPLGGGPRGTMSRAPPRDVQHVSFYRRPPPSSRCARWPCAARGAAASSPDPWGGQRVCGMCVAPASRAPSRDCCPRQGDPRRAALGRRRKAGGEAPRLAAPHRGAALLAGGLAGKPRGPARARSSSPRPAVAQAEGGRRQRPGRRGFQCRPPPQGGGEASLRRASLLQMAPCLRGRPRSGRHGALGPKGPKAGRKPTRVPRFARVGTLRGTSREARRRRSPGAPPLMEGQAQGPSREEAKATGGTHKQQNMARPPSEAAEKGGGRQGI